MIGPAGTGVSTRSQDRADRHAMQNSDGESPACRTPHALGCERSACIGSCLKPRDDDSLEVRVARYDEAMREHEEARVALVCTEHACEAAYQAHNRADAARRAAACRASETSAAVTAARAALRGSS